ncbi:MAG: hypothetical protein LBH25_15200 [Fibromonadaceae bacterium]|jgi:hypothetical protein|nr:hypothetical protein [Fibromonadaceae bacterium]
MKKLIVLAIVATVAFTSCAVNTVRTIYGPVGNGSGQKVKVQLNSFSDPEDVEKGMADLADKCPSKEVVNFYSSNESKVVPYTNLVLSSKNYFSGICKQSAQ